jgi:hypothetical protein
MTVRQQIGIKRNAKPHVPKNTFSMKPTDIHAIKMSAVFIKMAEKTP